MTNENLTLEKLIVAATLERHSLHVNKKSWIDTYAQWQATGEKMATAELSAVFESVKRELVQYLGDVSGANLGEFFIQ